MSKPENLDGLRARVVREHTVLLSLILAYVAGGKIGLALSYGHPIVSLIWPPTGIALGALLVFGYRMWPIIFGSSILLYATALGPTAATVGLSVGNTAEAALLA